MTNSESYKSEGKRNSGPHRLPEVYAGELRIPTTTPFKENHL